MSDSVFEPDVPVDLWESFMEVVQRRPDRPAIIHNGRIVGYARLAAIAGDVARAIGPKPGVVAVITSRTPNTIAGLLGIVAAGGAYCPIDPSYPAPRQKAMVAATDCRTVLTPSPAPEFGGSEFGASVTVLGFDEIAADGSSLPATGEPADPADPCYVLFTSGSTGQPRPVVTPRGAISVSAAALRRLFALTTSDRVLQFASLNWDTCLEEIAPTLTAGATVVFDDEAYTGSFPRFLRMVARRRITVLDLPTAFWHELVVYLSEEDTVLPESVRLLIIGGEAANPARLDQWRQLRHSTVRLLNTYGCTETTMITHAVDLDDPAVARLPRIPIGRPLAHVRQRISQTGELLVGGPAIALGYLGHPEQTAQRFIDLPDGRFFRTGDQVSRTGDGLLLHEGRLDHQVKIRGIRVDPAEVEAHLANHPAVRAAAVTAVTAAGRTALVGYVVATTAANCTDTLVAWLRQRVPAHLVPSRITFVPALVQTASGKIDRAGTHRLYAIKEARDDR